MSLGVGAYDDLATYVREQADAVAVVVVIAGGNRTRDRATHAVQILATDVDDAVAKTDELAAALETTARSMRADAQRMRRERLGAIIEAVAEPGDDTERTPTDA